MKVAIYARVSTRNHGQDTDTQLLLLRQYAAARGLEIVQEYVDNGFSGSKDHRPQLDKLMKDAHQRRFDAVLVFKLDRFGRSTSHLIRSLETEESECLPQPFEVSALYYCYRRVRSVYRTVGQLTD